MPQAAQTPQPSPVAPGTTAAPAPPAPSPAPQPGSIFVWLVVAAFVALLVGAGVRMLRRNRTGAPPPRLPPAPVRPDLGRDLAGAEARRADRAAEEAARKLQREEKKERQRAREELSVEERRRLREQEEEERKAAYKARKEAERAEREERAREHAEAEAGARQAEEEERRRALEAARAAEEERRRRIAAESGKTLAEGLARTREGGFVARLSGLFGGGQAQVSEATLGELEEILFTADIGVRTSMTLVEHAREKLRAREASDAGKLQLAIRSDIEGILERAQNGGSARAVPGLGLPIDESRRPWVIMVVGVNGAGKTTTIGKLAAKLKERGKTVVLGAGDTFRAAATEQLDVWADRADVPMVKGPDGGDPGSVAFDAITRAKAEGIDVVIVDTAGRLHTKAPLMEELKKVKRVMSKAREGAPDEVLLVLDATTGQNAIAQARQFHESLGVSGIVLTKLDGTAKGGVVIGISDELGIPVRLVGIGESLADLRPFEPREFVDALFGPEA